MADETVPLRDYVDTRLNAIEGTALERLHASNTALEIARQELRAWQSSHNDLQRKMESDKQTYISRPEHNALVGQVTRQGNQISVGIGILLAVQILIGVGLAVLLHR